MDVLTQSTEHIHIITPKGDVYIVVVIAKGNFIGCPILVNAVGIDQEVGRSAVLPPLKRVSARLSVRRAGINFVGAMS